MQQELRPPVSYAELERWPDDGTRHELYDGEVVVIPSPVLRHQRVADALVVVLREYERVSGGLAVSAPLDIVFDEYNLVQPDVVFFERRRLASLDMGKVIRIPPDLAIEVLSPGTMAIDRRRKMMSMARFGVAEYWLVDPRANTVELCVLERGRYTRHASVTETDGVESARLPGLSFPASRIFGF